MSSGYGNFQTDTEQIRSKETSTNCLLAKHRRIGRRGLHCTPCAMDAGISQHTHTHTIVHQEWALYNGCFTSLTSFFQMKWLRGWDAAIPGGCTVTSVTKWMRRIIWERDLLKVSLLFAALVILTKHMFSVCSRNLFMMKIKNHWIALRRAGT